MRRPRRRCSGAAAVWGVGLALGAGSLAAAIVACSPFAEAGAGDAASDGGGAPEAGGPPAEGGDPGEAKRGCGVGTAFTSPVELPKLTVKGMNAARFFGEFIFYSTSDSGYRISAARFATGALQPQDDLISQIVASPGFDEQPSPGGGGRYLFFQSQMNGVPRLFAGVRTAATGTEPYTSTAPLDMGLTPLAGEAQVEAPYAANGRLYFTFQPGSDNAARRIYTADVVTTDAGRPALFQPKALANIGGTQDDDHPVVSADGLEIFFSSKRGGTFHRTFQAIRKTTGSDFQTPSVVTGLDVGHDLKPTWISPDACDLYLISGNDPPSYVLAKASRK